MWHEILNNCRTFQLDDEPELIHIIKTGFHESHMAYMVVHGDAYELTVGKTDLMSPEKIKDTFNIDIDNLIDK